MPLEVNSVLWSFFFKAVGHMGLVIQLPSPARLRWTRNPTSYCTSISLHTCLHQNWNVNLHRGEANHALRGAVGKPELVCHTFACLSASSIDNLLGFTRSPS